MMNKLKLSHALATINIVGGMWPHYKEPMVQTPLGESLQRSEWAKHVEMAKHDRSFKENNFDFMTYKWNKAF